MFLDKIPVDAVYIQSEPNETVRLGDCQLQFAWKGTNYTQTASALMNFPPRGGLDFECDTSLGSKVAFELFDHTGVHDLRLIDRDIRFEGFCVGTGNRGPVFISRKTPLTVADSGKKIDRATFHIFNFPDVLGPEDFAVRTGTPPLQGASRCGRFTLRAKGYQITVVASAETRGRLESLKQKGGFIITHVGEIAREDGGLFATSELSDLLTCVRYFFSFALGRWAGVALPVALDSDGKCAFEQWGMHSAADGFWNGSNSWFDSRHGELLTEVFPGFFDLWSDPIWRVPLTHALYWYVAACDRRIGVGVDTAIILCQAAFEGLAWTHCVKKRKMVSEAAFSRRGLSAADKMRLLVSSLGISPDVPPTLTALNSRPGSKWADGMDAITTLRNSLVHADSDRTFPEGSYYESWLLALWFLDLILLRLCNHNGQYANRITSRWVGTVESVPWQRNFTQQA